MVAWDVKAMGWGQEGDGESGWGQRGLTALGYHVAVAAEIKAGRVSAVKTVESPLEQILT